MLSEFDSTNFDHEGNSNDSQLLCDIEAISKALYLHKPSHNDLVPQSRSRSMSVELPRFIEPSSNLNPVIHSEGVSYKDKKSSSIWNWKKPLKALTHIGNQKFNVCFFLHVHSIEGLPPCFNDVSLCVHWKRKDEAMQTSPSRVLKGNVEFDETLRHKCSVYGSKSGPHHSAKYEEKLFLIYATVIGAPGIDMGKQWVDLTRLLPLTLEELEREKNFSKWTTSFKLAGKAKGATLNVTFGYTVLRNNLIERQSNMNVSNLVNLPYNRPYIVETGTGFEPANSNRGLRRVGSVPSNLNCESSLGSQSVEIRICDDVSSNLGWDLSKSINFLYQKLNEVKLQHSQEHETLPEHARLLIPKSQDFNFDKDKDNSEDDNVDFIVIDKGIEISEKEQLESDESTVHTLDSLTIETINVDEITEAEDTVLDGGKLHSKDGTCSTFTDEDLVDGYKHEDNLLFNEESTIGDDLQSAFSRFFVSGSSELESPWVFSDILEQDNFMQNISDHKASKLNRSKSLDDVTESVASDFLNMLEIEHSLFGLSSENDPESPRERLLREFEKEVLASGNFFVDHGPGEHQDFGCISPNRSGCSDLYEDIDLFSPVHAAEVKQQRASSNLLSRRKTKVLEDLETEALMREWGLNEKAFQSSPRYCSDGFGSPVELLPEDPVELPPLGGGFGSFIQTRDGGCLRSMNPSLFRDSKNVGQLVLQVSHPIVLPAEMGSDVMEILQNLSLLGIQKLSLQLNELLPLENVTGKTLQQIAHDAAAPGSTGFHRDAPFSHDSFFGPDAVCGRREAEESCPGWFFKNMKTSLFGADMDLGFVSLEYLAPLVLDRIEAISIEGLRVQCCMSDQQAPSSISPEAIQNIGVYEGKSAILHGLFSFEGDSGMQLDDNRDIGTYVTRLLGLSIPIEEWLRIDAGIIGDKDQLSNLSKMIFASHHAKCMDSGKRQMGDINFDGPSYGKQGLLGNNITLALKVLHRDPLRNYESVGAPMLALIQVERAFFCPKPLVYSTGFVESSNLVDDHDLTTREDSSDTKKEGEMQEESSVWFKITEVHLSGLNTEPGKVPHWCTKTQQQCGTRWLVASGISKSYKNPYSKSKAIVVSHQQMKKMVQSCDTFWSLSYGTEGAETKWHELAGFTSLIRNPDLIFPK